MSIAEHKGHNWYNKGHPDGTNTGDGYGIIVCKDCSVRLFYGRLPWGDITEDEAVKNLPNGWNNRTIDDIWSLRPPHINKLSETLIEEATAADMPKMTDTELTVVEDVTPDTRIVRDHPSVNGDSSTPMESESLEVTELGANYTVTAHFSRTYKPTVEFGSVTCGFDIAETFPGQIDIERLRAIGADQFAILKAMVLTQLALPFSMNDEGIIHETFPGSQTVGRIPIGPAPHSPVDTMDEDQDAPRRSDAPAAPRSTGRTAGRQQASTGQRGGTHGPQTRGANTGAGGRRAPATTAIPEQADLWYELIDRPHEWFWNTNKTNPRAADYISTKYYKDDGWPVSLWETSPNGDNNLPDDDDWSYKYDALSEDDFAQQYPRKRD